MPAPINLWLQLTRRTWTVHNYFRWNLINSPLALLLRKICLLQRDDV